MSRPEDGALPPSYPEVLHELASARSSVVRSDPINTNNGIDSAVSELPEHNTMTVSQDVLDMIREFENSANMVSPLSELPSNNNSPDTPSQYKTAPSYSAIELPSETVEKPPACGYAKLKLSVHDFPFAETPTPDQCMAHLKVLAAFATLREEVSNIDGLFGIKDEFAAFGGPEHLPLSSKYRKLSPDERSRRKSMLREKRWSAYVSRAASRFAAWWTLCVEPNAKKTTRSMLQKNWALEAVEKKTSTLTFDADKLPPIDVLMVWHSFMLNPRAYLSDCLRFGKDRLWRTPFPWEAIAASIHNITFKYSMTEKARDTWEATTESCWQELPQHAPLVVGLHCPSCRTAFEIPATSMTTQTAWNDCFNGAGAGFGASDNDFKTTCAKKGCGYVYTVDKSRVTNFLYDLQSLVLHDQPMPGTLLFPNGKPVFYQLEEQSKPSPEFVSTDFPNKLLLNPTARGALNEGMNTKNEDFVSKGIKGVKECLDEALKNKELIHGVREKPGRVDATCVYSLRTMMSAYWEHNSMFSIDLASAVIRQCTFVAQMCRIDWLHSPALRFTMERGIVRYCRFITLMDKFKKQMAVPTMDIDLIWHTHQLHPKKYYDYVVTRTGRFVNHDDKVEEGLLSDGFEKTSRSYQDMYGEVYSECTCWYCEAIREATTPKEGGLLKKVFSHNKKRDQMAANLKDLHAHAAKHKHEDRPMDKNPHISAHNVVRTTYDAHDTNKTLIAQRNVVKARLTAAYMRAVARAEREKRPPPKREVYASADWNGLAVYPFFIPGGSDPCVAELYAGNPSCVNASVGAVGMCMGDNVGARIMSGGCGTVMIGCSSCSGGGGDGGGSNCSSCGGGCGGGCGG